MEKLIKLLNEHRREIVKKQSWITQWHYNAFTFSLDNTSWQQAELLIISKQYWFIQRLVQRGKVNLEHKKVLLAAWTRANWMGLECEWHSDYESLLMLLAIQDEPINFLISILK